MRRDLYVYISGPMTAKNGFSVEHNLAEGVDLFITLMKLGIPTHCPHLNGYPPSCWTEIPYDHWIALDEVVLDRCTHVLMMPRWRASTGAVREHDYAMKRGLPIAYSLGELKVLLGLTEAAGAAPSIAEILQAAAEAPARGPLMDLFRPGASDPPTTAPADAAGDAPPPLEPATPEA